MKELTSILLVTFFCSWKSNINPHFLFLPPRQVGFLFYYILKDSGRIQGGCSRLKVYKTIGWFSIILDFLERFVRCFLPRELQTDYILLPKYPGELQ